MILITGMDTGVVFCRRKDFIQLGGYNEQKLIRLTSARAVASMRKFEQHGNWHYFPLMARGIYAMFRPSKRFEKFSKRYWYNDRQT